MSGAGAIGCANLIAIDQDLESGDAGFLDGVEVPGKVGQGPFLRLAEREVANGFHGMGDLGIFGFLFFHLYLKISAGDFLYPQGRGVSVVSSLHVGQEQGGLVEGSLEGGVVPGLGDSIGGSGGLVLYRAEGPFAGLPGEEVDGFGDVFVDVLFLLPEVVSKVGQSDRLDSTADGVGLIGRGHRGHDHRSLGKGGAERHGLEAGGAGEGTGLNHGTVGQGNATLFHHQIGDGLGLMGAILVIPFDQSDVKAGFVDIA